MKKFRKDNLPYIAMVFGVAAVVLVIVLALQVNIPEPLASTKERKRDFTRLIGEGFEITRTGYPGIRFVQCGELSVAKRKLGSLTLGPFNILKVKDLKVVLPEEAFSVAGTNDSDVAELKKTDGAKEIAKKLGISKELLQGRLGGAKFSGLEIADLEVSRLDAGTNVVFCFSAQNAVATRSGLQLKDCRVYQNGVTNAVGKAVSEHEPVLKLRWNGGEMVFVGK